MILDETWTANRGTGNTLASCLRGVTYVNEAGIGTETEPEDPCDECGEAEAEYDDLCQECFAEFCGYDLYGNRVFELDHDDHLEPHLVRDGIGREVVMEFCAQAEPGPDRIGGKVGDPWQSVADDYIWNSAGGDIDQGFCNLVREATEWASTPEGASQMASSLLENVSDPLRAGVALQELTTRIMADLVKPRERPGDEFYVELARSLTVAIPHG